MKTIKDLAVACSLCGHSRKIYIEHGNAYNIYAYRIGCLCDGCDRLHDKDDARTNWWPSTTRTLREWSWMNYGDSEDPPPDWREKV